MGASIIHNYNKLYMEMLREYNLASDVLYLASKKGTQLSSAGVWDGSKYLFKDSKSQIMTFLSVLWRYGIFDGLNIKSLSKDFSEKWQKQYDIVEGNDLKRQTITWDSVDKFLSTFQLSVNQSAVDCLSTISTLFRRELVSGRTRNIYNQNSSENLSCIAAMVSVFGTSDDLYHVDGGNNKVFNEVLKSKADSVHFSTTVRSVSYDDVTKKYKVSYYKNDDSSNDKSELNLLNGDSVRESDTVDDVIESDEFDVVVIATPLELTKMKLENIPNKPHTERKFQFVHVTAVYGRLNPQYFGLEKMEEIPTFTMTSEDSTAPFLSQGISCSKSGDEHCLVKYFSPKLIEDKILDEIFLSRVETTRWSWYAYPKLVPNPSLLPVQIHHNLYYINAFESVLSIIEGSMLSARNIANLIAQQTRSRKESTQQATKEEL
eukprot:TRINITY_DN5540_c0_g1_i1.p1 TRINITY_DN5540_c0_g1~~TRINITY_DN5540_c0_g1_i1.p1  ORF type:complete len:505 (-),score=93.10 TRINITY_DN5540_c0_g1_i1:149-1444(-)